MSMIFAMPFSVTFQVVPCTDEYRSGTTDMDGMIVQVFAVAPHLEVRQCAITWYSFYLVHRYLYEGYSLPTLERGWQSYKEERLFPGLDGQNGSRKYANRCKKGFDAVGLQYVGATHAPRYASCHVQWHY